MSNRRTPNLSEKLACALLHIRNEDGSWLISDPETRENGTAKGILSLVEWDHIVLYAHGGTTAPQNLQPLTVKVHREKSREDTGRAAKSKRCERKEREFRTRLLAKQEGRDKPAPQRRKSYKPLMGGKATGFKRKMNGEVVRR